MSDYRERIIQNDNPKHPVESLPPDEPCGKVT